MCVCQIQILANLVQYASKRRIGLLFLYALTITQVQEVTMGYLLQRGPEEGRIMFPGSQPVSLARSNLHMLREQRDSYLVRRHFRVFGCIT